MRSLFAAVLVLAVPAFAGGKIRAAAKAVVAAASTPSTEQCDAYAKKMFELTVNSVDKDPELLEELKGLKPKEKAAFLEAAKAELRKEEKSFVKDAKKDCLEGAKAGELTTSDLACVAKQTDLDGLEKNCK
ncbi:MAG: hypothetical protein K1X89_14625 [Myxococcaceae bacterium]|nr:hypothetical protein [Myxococcaceae bacterium]